MNRTLMIILLAVCVVALIFIFAVILPRLKAAFAHTPTIVYVIITVILLAAIVWILITLTAPRGYEGSEIENIAVEDVNTVTRWDGKAVYVYVHGDEISVGEMLMSDENECIDTVADFANEGAGEIYLIDDYAQASIYKSIMTGLDDRGIKYLAKEQ